MTDNGRHTDRLRLRALCEADAEFILDLVNEPGWLRFIGDRDIHTIEAALAYIERCRDAGRKFGFTMDLVELKDGTPVGLCGLVHRQGLRAADLGFAVSERHAGRGYATEAAQLILREAAPLPELLAVCQPDNGASTAILTKLGFEREGEWRPDSDGEALHLYVRRGTAP